MRNMPGIFAGLLLLMASALKVHQLATTPFLNNFFVQSRELNVALALLELFFGFWLLSGWRGEASKKLAIGVFFVFFLATFVLLVRGEESCGCFGVFSVPPSVTLVIDAAVLVALVLWKPRSKVRFPVLITAVWLTSVVVVVWSITQFRPTTLDNIGTVANAGEMLIVKEELWVNKPLPIFDLLIADDKEVLLKGEWQVILYHHACPKCQKVIEETTDNKIRTALVEVPPFRGIDQKDSGMVKWIKLSDRYEWFVNAPVIVHLRDGIVID